MVLSKPELVAALQNEVRILLHLVGKVDATSLDYRPTPKQRSTIELLRYLSMMGPELLHAARTGAFDMESWTVAEKAAAERDLAQATAAIAAQAGRYAEMLADVSDEDLRVEVNPFGEKSSRGAFIVNNLLSGCAAYRMQLFLYLKASGREELGSMNLWGGMDAPAKA